MKNKLPLILIILTVLSVALAVGYTVYERSQSSPGMPQISFDKSSIEARVDASDEELLRRLQGISATLSKDKVASSVLPPRRAAASAASTPA